MLENSRSKIFLANFVRSFGRCQSPLYMKPVRKVAAPSGAAIFRWGNTLHGLDTAKLYGPWRELNLLGSPGDLKLAFES